jgi:hypothetical protein
MHATNIIIPLIYCVFFITRYTTNCMLRGVKGSPYNDPIGALFRFLIWILFFVTLFRVTINLFFTLNPTPHGN